MKDQIATPRLRHISGRTVALVFVAGLFAAVMIQACGGSSPAAPTPPSAPVLTSIVPASGSAGGGTVVTIAGANFAAGAAVTIGGVAATNVSVQTASSMTATTGAHAVGAADVVVTMGTGSATLPNAFTYLAPPLTVFSVTPSSGTTLGGTVVTIAGDNFAPDAVVSIGGAQATDVRVQSSTSLLATTRVRAAGPAEVAVTAGGLTGTLLNGFTFVAPPPTVNAPPVINSLAAATTRQGVPAQYLDLGDEMVVTASVADAETPVGQLTYQWEADRGVIVSAAGAVLRWRAQVTGATPVDARLTLTVIERYAATDEVGLPVTREHRISSSTTVTVHDSKTELGEMAELFLVDFSEQRLTPEGVLRNFTPTCRGYAAELDDVRENQTLVRIETYDIGLPKIGINFDGLCEYRGRPADACIQVPVEWRSTVRATGARRVTIGTDHVTGVFRGNRWWLCDSDLEEIETLTAQFKR